MPTLKINKGVIYGLIGGFIILNTLLIYKEVYIQALIPIVLIVAIAAFLWMDKLFLALSFMVPLSIPLSKFYPNLAVDMFLPTEPILAGLLIIFILKLILNNTIPKKVWLHPVSIGIYFYLFWIFISTLTSTIPVVSFKFLLSKLWFIATFYFLAIMVFRHAKNARHFTLAYAFGLGIVVVYALVRHVKFGILDEKIAHWAANPFYKDHTSYGALLSFFIPPLAGLTFYKTTSYRQKLLWGTLLLLLLVGLVFSYSRAAWISFIGAIGLFIIIKLKIKVWVIASGSLVIGLLLLLNLNFFQQNLSRNNQDSSTNLKEHVQSISNISTDASNLERINRWNCALRMFAQKPIFGWGPGTYMFQYAPFQLSHEKTIISTNRANRGNAHSEYLGPLAEQGIFGLLSFLLIVVLALIYGFRAIKNTNPYIKMLSIGALTGFFTYLIHGVLNNFLDTDKASAPFWGFIALIVAIDIYHKEGNF